MKHIRAHRATRSTAVLSLAFLLLGASCDLRENESELISLNIPFRQQQQWDYCGTASVLMWRLKNGYPEVPQTQIYNWMGGGVGGSGTDATAIRNAAQVWADVWDAQVDWGQWEIPEEKRKFFARQISSINQRTPVIPIVEGGLHAGIINGGSWGKDAGGASIWNEIVFHDPRGFENRSFGAAHWMDEYSTSGHNTYTQIISNSAIQSWENEYVSWGDSLGVYGSGYSGPYDQQ